MALASDAIRSARIYLNDINGITWSDSILMPLLQEAYSELMQELDLNQLGVLKYQTCPILVPAGHFNLGTDQPTNILDPISMMEKTPGMDDEDYQEMILVDYLPEVDQTDRLVYWAWRREVIMFVGATVDRTVILRYKGSLPVPNLLTDPIGITFGQTFLGPRVASLAYDSIGRDSSKLTDIAQRNLYNLIKRGVLEDQRPITRRPYRERKGYTVKVTPLVGGQVLAIPSGTFQRTVLLKDLTVGNNIADNVTTWGPPQYTGLYKAIITEAVLRKAITQNLVVTITMNTSPLITITIPRTQPILVPLNFSNYINPVIPNEGVFGANITASDSSFDADGIASFTTIYQPYSAGPPCGQ
jgi:hypothetical protein